MEPVSPVLWQLRQHRNRHRIQLHCCTVSAFKPLFREFAMDLNFSLSLGILRENDLKESHREQKIKVEQV